LAENTLDRNTESVKKIFYCLHQDVPSDWSKMRLAFWRDEQREVCDTRYIASDYKVSGKVTPADNASAAERFAVKSQGACQDLIVQMEELEAGAAVPNLSGEGASDDEAKPVANIATEARLSAVANRDRAVESARRAREAAREACAQGVSEAVYERKAAESARWRDESEAAYNAIMKHYSESGWSKEDDMWRSFSSNTFELNALCVEILRVEAGYFTSPIIGLTLTYDPSGTVECSVMEAVVELQGK